MTPEVREAVEEIQRAYQGSRLDVVEDGQGGAFLTLHGVPLEGGLYQQQNTWVGFHVTHTYPYADIYPHFVRVDLSRKDGKPLGEGLSVRAFRDEPAVQISRKSNRLDPTTQTVLLKLHKVLRG